MKKDGIKTRIVQMMVVPGDVQGNTEKILGYIEGAKKDSLDMAIFPEMAVPGYLLGDNWERLAFLKECEQCNDRIRRASSGIIVVFGSVGIDWNRKNEDGRVRKYNALFVAEDGAFKSPESVPYDFAVKSLLPDYREFDETRHFYDLRKLALEERCSVEDMLEPVKTTVGALGCILCEDAWDIDYGFSPLRILAGKNADIFVSISASPFTVNKNHKRSRVFSERTSELKRPLVYANCVGIQNNGKCVFTFDGSSSIYDGHGNCVTSRRPFQEICLTQEIPLDGSEFGGPCRLQHDEIAEIYDAVHFGTREFLDLCGIQRVVVGISGGIDSSVVAAIYGRILPPDRLLLVSMPGRYNSSRTRDLARMLAANIGCLYCEIPIEESCSLTARQMDGKVVKNFHETVSWRIQMDSRVMENVQARDRSARILAAIAAAFRGAFTSNANKSEATVGYTTLYGDLAGYFANIADLWKTEVYELAEYMNNTIYQREVIPAGSIRVTPSAELSPDQNIERKQGDPLIYEYHDCLFQSWVEWWNRATPEEILQWYAEGILEDKIGYDGNIAELFTDSAEFIEDLERWWNVSQGLGLAKRIQSPPILAIKKRSFGFDLRESQMPPPYTARYLDLKDKLLNDRE